ncbi:hypothetical protein [Cystobacter ferrugineus]|uniref:Uncharacterized protein n=1 Tax=Cystobacter ferrugineus TaxID=83449 RepID=A0A1L9B115_9BACT|nr:hypothetical protein [Cystobacter ferrugineus]OJH35959.1 hypothetical protein BON30_35730 [Cystobacter ferrugineus]
MSPQASPGDAGASARRTSLWQLALVALALAAFFLYVLLPIGTLPLLFSGLVGFFWAQQKLAQVGALEPGAFGGAMYLSGALLLLGMVLLVLTAGWNLLRRMAGETRPPPLLLRWPWWTFGFGLLLACRFFMPSGAREREVPGFAGALVLATAVWAVLSVGYLFYTLGTGGLSLAWRLARVSPFGAGLLTVGALACVGFMMLLGAVMDEFASQVRAMPRPRPDRSCSAPAMECARRLFLASPRAMESSVLSGSARASASSSRMPGTWCTPPC